jgi:hypothetical protein
MKSDYKYEPLGRNKKDYACHRSNRGFIGWGTICPASTSTITALLLVLVLAINFAFGGYTRVAQAQAQAQTNRQVTIEETGYNISGGFLSFDFYPRLVAELQYLDR